MSTADELQAEGIAAATEHAEKVRPGWTDDAVEMIRRYVDHIKAPFLIEDARAWAYQQGLDEPPSLSAWGAVPRRAAKLGIIHHSGTMAPTKSAGGHKDEKVVWNPGEGTASAPHDRREVLAKAQQLRGFAETQRKQGFSLFAEELLGAARMLDNLAPRS